MFGMSFPLFVGRSFPLFVDARFTIGCITDIMRRGVTVSGLPVVGGVSCLEKAGNDSGGDEGTMEWMDGEGGRGGRMPSALGVGARDWIWSGSAYYRGWL